MNLHQITPLKIRRSTGLQVCPNVVLVRFVVCLTVLLLLFPIVGFSQAKTPSELTIRHIEPNALEAPRFSVSTDAEPGTEIMPRSQWLELRSEFRTDKDWIDEVEFKYYLLMDQSNARMLPPGAARANILTGKVTYEDVPKHSRHTSTMFLSPVKLMRYGKPLAWRVEVTIGGKPVAMEEKVPASLKGFQTRPGKNLLLKRNETPFMFIDRNSYNDIKANTVR